MKNHKELSEFEPSSFKAPEQPSRLREHLKKIKKVALKAAAFSVMFGGSHMIGYGQTRTAETRPRIAPVAAETTERKQKTFSIAEIRKGLRTDPAERIFINTDADPENELVEMSGGRANSGVLSYDEIDQILAEKKNKVTKFEIDHTHELTAYREVFKAYGVTGKEQDEYRQGTKELPPHPPSMNDFLSQLNLQNSYESRNLKVQSKVIDASGIWSYTIEKNNQFLNEVVKAREEYGKSLDDSLSPQEWEILFGLLQSGEVSPKSISSSLKNKTEAEDRSGVKRKLGRTLTGLEQKNMERHGESMKLFDQIEKAGAAVIVGKSVPERDKAIAEYIALCAQNGIKVIYAPTKKSN